MPTKILTDRPQIVSHTHDQLLGGSYADLVEPDYFSIPLEDEDTAVLDPADTSRELRPGEVFVKTPMWVTNETASSAQVYLRLVREGGTQRVLVNGLIVPAGDTLFVPINGLSLFKRDLASPANAGDRLQAYASTTGALSVAFSYSMREAVEHAPDTEAGA